MSPKDSLVNMEDKLSSTYSQWDLSVKNSAQSLSGAQVPLLHGCVWSQWEWQDLHWIKGFLLYLSQLTLPFLLRLFCSCAWPDDLTFKSHLSHLKQN